MAPIPYQSGTQQDNGFRNIVEERFDAGVRLGESLDKDMIANSYWTRLAVGGVGSAAYFAIHGTPHHPQELVSHNCINQRQIRSGGLYAWEFEKDGRALKVRVDGQFTFNTSYAQIDAAAEGYGIAYLPENLVEADIASGRLVQVLDDWSPFFDGYYLYYPSRRQNSPAFSIIVNALRV